MIHEIEPMVYDNHWENRKICKGDQLIITSGRKMLVRNNNGTVELPLYDIDFKPELTEYLFKIDDYCFYNVEEKVGEFADFRYENINTVRNYEPMWMVHACSTAFSLSLWYRNNAYCGCCGKKTHKSVTERAIVCDDCHNTIYPKICPGIIAAVVSGDKIAMTKAKGRDHWALVSGFTEIGEPIEDTVRREVMEEIGLKVKNIRFYRSQPWPFSDSLLCGFVCEVDGDETITVDPGELDDAKWVSRADCAPRSNNTSLTQEMIGLFKDNKL